MRLTSRRVTRPASAARASVTTNNNSDRGVTGVPESWNRTVSRNRLSHSMVRSCVRSHHFRIGVPILDTCQEEGQPERSFMLVSSLAHRPEVRALLGPD